MNDMYLSFLGSSILFIVYPLAMFVLLVVWCWFLIRALQEHRPWHWILFLTFVPILSIPFYLLNFYLLDRGNNEGYLDRNVRQLGRIGELKNKVEEFGVPGDIQELAIAYFENQNYREALKYFQMALNNDPEDIKCQYFTGVSFLAIEEGARALPHLEYVLDESPRYLQGEARLFYAKALLNAGDTDRSRTEFERAASHFNLPEASVRVARYLMEENNLEDAQKILVEMLSSVGELQAVQRRAHQRWIKVATDDLAKIQKLLRDRKKQKS